MFISPAYAQAAGFGGFGGLDGAVGQFLPLVLIFVVFYVLLIRPQQKRQKQHAELLKALRRNDKVVIGGGIHGTVSKLISDTEVEVEIAAGVKVKVVRSSIQDVLTKPEPVSASSDKKEVEAPTQDNSASNGK